MKINAEQVDATIETAAQAAAGDAASVATAQTFATGAVAASHGKLQQVFAYTDVSTAALTRTLSLGSALPANARIIGREILVGTAFSGTLVSAVAIDIGLAGGSEIAVGASVFTGAAAAQSGVDGANPTGSYGGQQITVKFTAIGALLSALASGSITIRVFYEIIA